MKNSLFAKIKENPDSFKKFRPLALLTIVASGFIAVIGMVAVDHPNPYLASAMIALGFSGTAVGLSIWLLIHQSRMAIWLMLLSGLLFLLAVYLFIQVILYP